MSKLLIFASFIFLFCSVTLAQESVPPTTAPVKAEGALMGGRVTKAVLTTDVKNRVPVDELTNVGSSVEKVFFYTEINGLEHQEVTHRWEYDGKVMGEVKFNVGAPRWRTWSSKKMNPSWIGQWKVSVVDSTGKVLGEKTFAYEK